MPVFRGRYAGFGDLVLDGGALNAYALHRLHPQHQPDGRRPGLRRHVHHPGQAVRRDEVAQADVPADPATDPYFPDQPVGPDADAGDGADGLQRLG